MNKRAPSIAQISVMVIFALSCFGLLTYIWKSFGGPSPLAPKGYRVTIDFDEATQLSDTADVRISGISVGRVKKSQLGAGDRTRVQVEIESRYAPLPRDTRAIIRQKTLLGESYIELTPGDRRKGMLFDNSKLPRAQVVATTELDEVTRALDLPTRRALQRFVRAMAALEGEGYDLNAALGHLPGFTTDSTTLLRTLDREHRAVRQLVRDGGAVFDALGRRQGELSGLVRAADAVLATTARRDRDLAETVRILPTTLLELRPTLEQVKALSLEAHPLVRDLRPGARALAPALRDATVLAPEAERLFGKVDRLVSVSREGVPATTRVVRAAHPLFKLLPPTAPRGAAGRRLPRALPGGHRRAARQLLVGAPGNSAGTGHRGAAPLPARAGPLPPRGASDLQPADRVEPLQPVHLPRLDEGPAAAGSSRSRAPTRATQARRTRGRHRASSRRRSPSRAAGRRSRRCAHCAEAQAGRQRAGASDRRVMWRNSS